MAEGGGESGKSMTLLIVVVVLVVLYFMLQSAQKTVKSASGKIGEGIGKGAAETVITKGASAIGSFLGGLFGGGGKSGGGGKGGSSAADSENDDDDEGEYDTSSFRVYDDDA